MSLLSLKKNEKSTAYIKLILYQSQLTQNSKTIKNVFPYFISIQFNKRPEKLISPINNVNQVFNISKTKYKYFIRKNEQKVIIKISCYTKTFYLMKKNIASEIIEIKDIKNFNSCDKNSKKWYYLKNKNCEIIIKLLISIDLCYIENISNNFFDNINNNYYDTFTNTETGFESNNMTVNKPESINIHINSFNNKNLNIITNNIYLTNYNYISLNDSLKSFYHTKIIKNKNNINKQKVINKKTYNDKILFSNTIKKRKVLIEKVINNKNKQSVINSNLFSYVEKIIKTIKQKFYLKLKNLEKQKENLRNEESEYIKKENNFNEEKIKFHNEIKSYDKSKEIYENNYLDLNINFNKFENNLYRTDIQNDINKYEKEVLNINNIPINYYNYNEIMLEKKLKNNILGIFPIECKKKNLENKMHNNNFINNQRYSFESNGKTNSIYLLRKSGISNKIYNNNISDNKDNYISNNINTENNFNEDILFPSPACDFFKQMKKVDNISISKSKSNSPFSEKLQKKSLINNYSRSTFNMINDLYLNDETNENKIQKTEKVQNTLNTDDILNSKNQKSKLFKRKQKINVLNKTKNNFINTENKNSSTTRSKRKKIDINDDKEYSLYYNLEKRNTLISNTINNNDNEYTNKTTTKNIIDKNLKKALFKQRTENYLIKSYNFKRNTKEKKFIDNKKTVKKINQQSNFKMNHKNNRVFKNVFNTKNNNAINSNKILSKNRENINSNITLNNDINNTFKKKSIKVLFPLEIKLSDNNISRNLKNIQYNSNTSKKQLNTNTNEKPKVNVFEKMIHNKKNQVNLVKFLQYNNIEKSREMDKKLIKNINETKNSNQILMNKKCYLSKILKNDNFNTQNNKINSKKDSDNKINNSNKASIIIQSKKIFNNLVDNKYSSRISFYINRMKTLNSFESDNKNNIKKIMKKSNIRNMNYPHNNNNGILKNKK